MISKTYCGEGQGENAPSPQTFSQYRSRTVKICVMTAGVSRENRPVDEGYRSRTEDDDSQGPGQVRRSDDVELVSLPFDITDRPFLICLINHQPSVRNRPSD